MTAPKTSSSRITARKRRALAYAVHGLTASGAVLGFLALTAAVQGDAQTAFLWLGAALLIDGVDGPLARWIGVKDATPNVDGAALDNVVDFLTYVVAPAAIVWAGGIVPPGWEIAASGLVTAAGAWTFANADMKTHDWWFAGFPAVWNVVVFGLWGMGAGGWTALAVIAGCAALTFTRVKFVHPIRVRAFRPATLAATAAWAAASAALLAFPESAMAGAARWLWGVSAGWFGALTIWRSFGPGREAPAEGSA
ncbi:MAG: CDP-alcohol phosphatidyltransferase family protein [Pseudomonadota bacterium]